MPLKIAQKKQLVAELAEITSSALSVVAVDYCGLTAAEMTKLRANAHQAGVRLRVVRNTLANRAFQGTPYECMTKVLVGPVLLAFADEEPGATARLLRDFAKDHEKLEVTALSIGGKLLDKSQLGVVASLPTYDEAVAKLMSVMQAPIAKLVRTMAEPHAKLVRTLAAIRDSKQA